VSGLTDLTVSAVASWLRSASVTDCAATELNARYISPHCLTTQPARYREVGRVLAYAMIVKGSVLFNAALPLWKYLTNRALTSVDLYFMYPTLYDVSLVQ